MVGTWRRGGLITIMQIAILILEGLLGLFTAFTAYGLFYQTPPSMAAIRKALNYPRWYWLLAGVVATIGAVGLLVGLAIAQVGALACVWMVCYFIVATITHLLRRDFRNVAPPVVFLAICVALVALRWGDLAPLLPHA